MNPCTIDQTPILQVAVLPEERYDETHSDPENLGETENLFDQWAISELRFDMTL
jgi:hypothetical protein